MDDFEQADRVFRLYFYVYVAIGVPIAWLHMRQQNMLAAEKSLPPIAGVRELLIYTLSVMWPLLLFAMMLNYLFCTPPRRPGSALDRASNDP